MSKVKLVFDIQDIELTPEEIKQCVMIMTYEDIVRLMPPLVLRKIEEAKAEAVLSMRWEKDD